MKAKSPIDLILSSFSRSSSRLPKAAFTPAELRRAWSAHSWQPVPVPARSTTPAAPRDILSCRSASWVAVIGGLTSYGHYCWSPAPRPPILVASRVACRWSALLRECANFVIDTARLAEVEVMFFSPGWKTPPVLQGSVATVINYGEIGRVDSCQFHAETSGEINYCRVSTLEYNDIFFWVTPVTIGPAFCKALYFYASLVSTRKCKAAVCLCVCLFCPFSYR